MRKLLLFLFSLQCFTVLSQLGAINWGPPNDRKGSILQVLPRKGLNFYTYRVSGGSFLQIPKVSSYDDGLETYTKKIEQQVDQNMVTLEEVVAFNNELVGFFSDKKEGLNTLYMIRYDEAADPYGAPTIIASYPIQKGLRNNGYFQIILSKNRQFLCVEYVIPGRRAGFDQFGYKVLNTKFEPIIDGEYELPYESRYSSVDLHHVTDNGDYLIGVSVFSITNFGVWRDHSAIEKAVVIQLSKDGNHLFDLQIDQQRVFDFNIASSDSVAVITGTYGEAFAPGAKGVFLQRINLRSHQVEKEAFHQFPALFLEEELALNRKNYFERKDNHNRFGSELMNYTFRSVSLTADGSLIVVAEQFYIYQQNTSDGRGLTQTLQHYYYNDVVVYRMNREGELQWIVRIPKEQHSINDFGYFSSIKVISENGKTHVFFNDTKLNYSNEGAYLGQLRVVNFPITKRNFVFAMATIDEQNGQQQRTVFSDYNLSNGVIVPKLSVVDSQQKEVLFLSVGKKEQFGLLKYN
jgi:hypothetical protein